MWHLLVRNSFFVIADRPPRARRPAAKRLDHRSHFWQSAPFFAIFFLLVPNDEPVDSTRSYVVV